MYLTGKLASPVYELLGQKGLVMDDSKPELDKAYIYGSLAYRYHTGGHTDAPDWPAFLDFAARHFSIGYLNVSVNSITLGASDRLSASFTVSSGNPVKVRRKGIWIKAEVKSNAGLDSVTVVAKGNKRDARAARIIINGKDRKQTVVVRQAAMNPRTSVAPGEIGIGSREGSTGSFDIMSNSAWNISPGAQWLRISEDAGMMNKSVVVSASQNPFARERSAILTIASPGLPDEAVNVIQAAGEPILNVSSGKLSFAYSGGSSSPVIITSNAPWRLTCSERWITADEFTGDGFKRVTIIAEENTNSSERKAEIKITVSDSHQKVIVVTQSGR
jgi:hypothetical protein